MKKIMGFLALVVISTGAALYFELIPTTPTCCAMEAEDEIGGLISPVAYQTEFEERTHLLLDVRTPPEFYEGYISGALNIPLQELPNRLSELPQDQPIVIYCRSGNRSAEAWRILRNAGYRLIYDMGGIIDWTSQGFPVERS
ncbi:MAG: phage shock protein E [Chloroflexi bacterium AL-W]|nr:phage shock protein E [Chloroflexi bacterium AL-W]